MLRYLAKSVPNCFKSFETIKAGSVFIVQRGSENCFSFCFCRSRNLISIWNRSLLLEAKDSSIFNSTRSIRTMASLPADVKARLDQVADAKIDAKGKFKYILIKVYAADSDGKHVDANSKLVVRGRADCEYHADIFDKFQEETSKLEGIDDDVLGGGRILREGNKISVFGYSQGYGRADHTLTVEVLKKSFPTHEITWSNDGY